MTDSGVYLDCNATTPMEPAVQDLILRCFTGKLGNAGSRTHEYGLAAKLAVEKAREQVASVVQARSDEVIFTSGATESNNISLVGLAEHGEKIGKRHIVSTAIEHKAVLEPLEILELRGFEVTLVKPNISGVVEPDAIKDALRSDTLVVSVMHVNNETGVRQPIPEIAEHLQGVDAYFHIDAAQGFGKIINDLCNKRIDLISVTSHKLYGPIGVGALIARNRGYRRPPLKPLVYGGGQERGLRPGTIPVALVAGFGLSAELAELYSDERREKCMAIREKALNALGSLDVQFHGDQKRVLPHVLNFSIPGLDSEAVMLALKGVLAISNGSACTSQNYTPSHVLIAMGLREEEVAGAVRLSWCHLTDEIDWLQVTERITSLR